MQEHYTNSQRWFLFVPNLKIWNKKDVLLWFFKVFSVGVCFALFVVLTWQSYIKYNSNMTATNKIGDSDEELSNRQLPCLTFCPFSGFNTGMTVKNSH